MGDINRRRKKGNTEEDNRIFNGNEKKINLTKSNTKYPSRKLVKIRKKKQLNKYNLNKLDLKN